jgi:hypothetical protein
MGQAESHSGGRGPALAELPGPPPSVLPCLVATGVRVMTKTGAPRVEELAGGDTVELWTPDGWARARVTPFGEGPALRVHLSDGSTLECAPATLWPVVDVRGPRPPSPPGGEGGSESSRESSTSSEGSAAPLSYSTPVGGAPPARSQSGGGGTPPREMRGAIARRRSEDSAVAVPLALPRRRPRASWAPKPAGELRPGDRVALCPPVPPAAPDPRAPAPAVQSARAAGARFGDRVTRWRASVAGLDAGAMGGREAPGLSAEEARAYVDGWAAAQRGCLVGCESAVADLQVLLRRAGVQRTLLEKTPLRASLHADAREAWPSTDARSWTRRLRTAHQKVTEVERLDKEVRLFCVTVLANPSRGPGVAAVAVGNTMVVAACAPAEAPQGAPPAEAPRRPPPA